MRVRIFKKNDDTIRNEDDDIIRNDEDDNKVLISKNSLDRLILDVLDEMMQEVSLVQEEPSKMRAEGACASHGFYSYQKLLQFINAINSAEKGKLFATD